MEVNIKDSTTTSVFSLLPEKMWFLDADGDVCFKTGIGYSRYPSDNYIFWCSVNDRWLGGHSTPDAPCRPLKNVVLSAELV